jgi:hypothetical protein
VPIKYVFLAFSGDHGYAEPTKVLTARITGLEKLQDRLEAQK